MPGAARQRQLAAPRQPLDALWTDQLNEVTGRPERCARNPTERSFGVIANQMQQRIAIARVICDESWLPH
jgi:hypothetical protein